MILHQLGVRLIAYDRPGYGGSERLKERSVAHAAADVAAIADQFELKRFAVVGRSGGGPHALACAALLSDRITRAATLVSMAPWQAPGLDWFDGMTASNETAYRKAVDVNLSPGSELRAGLERDAIAKAQSPESLIPDLGPEMPDADRRIVSDARIRGKLLDNFTGAVSLDEQRSPKPMDGWLDDVLSFCKPWGFDPASITRPVLLWHGEQDVFSPPSHFRWLADHIKGVTAVLEPGSAHFGALLALPRILRWLVDDRRTYDVRSANAFSIRLDMELSSGGDPVRG
jgi:pimeloyl-ACP methyl ester carboxylesterase